MSLNAFRQELVQQSTCSHHYNKESSFLENAVNYFEDLLEKNDGDPIKPPSVQNVFVLGDSFTGGSTYYGSFNQIGNVGKHASILSHNAA
ncbi:MAG: hypothetical protein C5B47_06380 [Verrucomicrobia bacterium]|nr:MAG: hypothetical protein C5B47_06380 [Verrucomicrobiota bacterium]